MRAKRTWVQQEWDNAIDMRRFAPLDGVHLGRRRSMPLSGRWRSRLGCSGAGLHQIGLLLRDRRPELRLRSAFP